MSVPYKGPGPMNWKPSEQYDISNEERANIIARGNLRDMNRHEFAMKQNHPFITNLNWQEPWDPALERYNAMLLAKHKYFKWNWKTFKYMGPFMFGSWLAIFTMLYRSRVPFERKCERGEFLYKDRNLFC